ncbi:MAG TPA: adenylate/guanylate cyclase domain-containing protein [Candidatus Limnocylindria bacterium]|nr:adenylate/guanylate cyclase domain-containing protein [Candidatus Limnocylindria bacterium]
MTEQQSERRLITSLFVDVVGSTELTAKLGPERWKRVLAEAFGEIRDLIVAEGGTVEKYVGDAIFAIFGAPTAHPDDAARALRAALGCTRWAATQTGTPVPVAVRLGVETGEALVDVRGVTVEHQQMAVGTCVVLASRLQAHADPGQVLVGPGCHAAAPNGVEFEELGVVELKGLGATPVWRLADIHADASRELPYVGRNAEREVLRLALSRVTAGRAALAVVSGPPGQGKTRLVQEFLRQDAPHLRVLLARCRPGGERGAQTPLRQLLAGEGVIDAQQLGERCRTLFSDRIEADRVADRLGHSAGIGLSEELGKIDIPSREDEIAHAWRRYLGALGAERSLAVWVEDVHWAEPEVVRLIDRLTLAGQESLLIIATARPEFAESAGIRPSGHRFFIELDPLDAEAARSLAGTIGEVDDDLVDRAEGNPLFLIELARARATRVEALPVTLQGAIGARLDELSRDERELLQHAAVAGESFTVRDVALLTGRDRGEVARAVEHLTASLYLRRLGNGYAFHHALLHDVAYGRLTDVERMKLHARFAREGISPDDPEALAHHWWAALRPPDGDWVWENAPDLAEMQAAAFGAHVAAAAGLAQRFAHERAIETFGRALLFTSAPLEEATAEKAIGDAYKLRGDGDDAWTHYLRALDAYRRAEAQPPPEFYADVISMPVVWLGAFKSYPDNASIAALIEDGEALARREHAELALTRILRLKGAFTSDPAFMTEATELATALPDGPAKAQLFDELGYTWQNSFDEFDRAQAMNDRADALRPVQRDDDLYYVGRCHLAHARGDLAQATDLADRHLAATAKAGPHVRGHAFGNEALVRFATGDWVGVVECGERARELIRDNPGTRFCSSGAGLALVRAAAVHAVAGRVENANAEVAAAAPTRQAGQGDAFLAFPLAALGRRADIRRIFATAGADRGFLGPALTVLEMWDEVETALQQLDEAASRGGRFDGAMAAAMREERAAAGGGTKPRHALLHQLGYEGWSRFLSFRPVADPVASALAADGRAPRP